ncbi:glycerate kinase [Alteribacter natronophilus]|uniref:glycerate kinase n=1 Tax=Alteribacter natronophilus TaxID=2583810 RepID=UPI00110DAF94|nr:glycerate kinase [Alteribacter natronophilus]TMW72088.1 glycerate kinase [Alteribacter natronophilus]
MKILIAPDSFKGSISSTEAARIIESAVKTVSDDIRTRTFPMADGGEGTVDAILLGTGGHRIVKEVRDPLGRPIQAALGWMPEERTAVIETAAASGLPLLAREELDPLSCTTFGTGELILEALNLGAETIVLGLGGSATVDCGTGIFEALGARFIDSGGQVLNSPGGKLGSIAEIDTSALDPRLGSTNIVVASDVTNPLLGKDGAVHVFGPQKGVTAELLVPMENDMAHFARVVSAHTGRDETDTPGSGAAGGIGFLLRSLLSVTFRPGIELIMETSGFTDALPEADLMITGEGRVDGQSLFGKVPAGIGRLAKQHGIPTAALAGSIGSGIEALEEHGVCVVHPIVSGPISLEEAMNNAESLLFESAVRLIKTIRLMPKQ